MKNPPVTILIFTGVFGLLLVVLFVTKLKDSGQSGKNGRGGVLAGLGRESPGVSKGPAVPGDSAIDLSASDGRYGALGISTIYRKQFGSRVSPRVREFLAANKDSPSALLAVWFLTGDEAAASKLVALAESDPKACADLTSFNDGQLSDKQLLSTISACLAKNPEDVGLNVLFAAYNAKNGNSADAIEALKRLKGMGKTDLGEIARGRSMRELFLLSGFPLQEAWFHTRIAEGQMGDELATTLYGINKPVIIAMKTSDENGKIELATNIVEFATRLWDGHQPFTGSDLRMSMLEKMALKNLPADVEYGDSGLKVADRITELEGMVGKMNYLGNEIMPFLQASDEITVGNFLRRYETDGVKKAVEWLEEIRKARGN